MSFVVDPKWKSQVTWTILHVTNLVVGLLMATMISKFKFSIKRELLRGAMESAGFKT